MIPGLCERCKSAQATFHLTNIDKFGNKAERHLCDKCAVEEGMLQPSAKIAIDPDELLKFVQHGKQSTANLASLVCEHCGISFVEFRNHGLLGCAHDYDVFREPLLKLIQRAHNDATHHTGKSPRGVVHASKPGGVSEIRRLKKHLEDAVAAEDYERAAELRDKIRTLEGGAE